MVGIGIGELEVSIHNTGNSAPQLGRPFYGGPFQTARSGGARTAKATGASKDQNVHRANSQ